MADQREAEQAKLEKFRLVEQAEVSTIAPGTVGDLPNDGGYEHDEQ